MQRSKIPGRVNRPPFPVGGVASGAAPSDGNDSDIVSWLFANDQWTEEAVPDMLEVLMEQTMKGHLAWVCFPAQGFRF